MEGLGHSLPFMPTCLFRALSQTGQARLVGVVDIQSTAGAFAAIKSDGSVATASAFEL